MKSRRKERVDIWDVAQRADVSIATVSRVMNRIPSVNSKLANRVLKAAKDLHYTPNTHARGLVSGRSRLIGLIVSEITNPFFPELIQSFETEAVARGYEVLIGSTNYSAQDMMRCVRRMVERKVEGVAVMTFGMEEELLQELSHRNIPVVSVGSTSRVELGSSLEVDYRRGIQEAVQHLAVMGHRDISFISGSLKVRSALLRQKAFIASMAQIGIEVTAEHLVEGNHTMEGGFTAAERLFDRTCLPTAILCSNDMTAIGVLHAVSARKLKVPEDISIIGFDDIHMAQFTVPPLTSIRMACSDLAAAALDALPLKSEGHEAPAEPHVSLIPTRLIVRQTSGYPRQLVQQTVPITAKRKEARKTKTAWRPASALVKASVLLVACFLTACRMHAQSSGAPAVGPPAVTLGSAWYPEQWPEARWESDLALMQQAHLHVIRVGEFAWSSLEPTEGDYQLDWLERAINLAGKHGIYTVLGTPTATPPAWLTTKYPETLRIDDNGHRDEHGNRLQYNWSNEKYLALSRDIVQRLATRFGHNPYVIGWQLDNEISQTSTDDGTRKKFQDWLRTRYGTLDALNARWTTAYWSQTYTDWAQIPIPKHGGVDRGNPGLLLCWRLFVSDTWRVYLLNQIDVIRPRSDARQFITTNTMGFFQYYDHYITEDVLDLAAWDNYMPDAHINPVWNGMGHDLTRGFKRKNFWVMETQPGFVNWSNVNIAFKRGDERALIWHDIAHGADAVNFWQWRSALNGQEQYHGTLVGADGQPIPVYAEIQQTGAELEKLAPVLAGTTVESDVAILHSYESRWAIEWQPHSTRFDPLQEMARYYGPLHRATHAVDIVPPSADLSKYKLVVAPALNLTTDAEASNLIAYVKAGGHLLLTPRSGMKDADNGLQPQGQPGPLAALLGGRVEQFFALKEDIPVSGSLFGSTKASIWAELLSTSAPETKVLMRYGKSNGWLDGQPAILTRRVGNGSITYVGTVLDEDNNEKLVAWLLAQAKVIKSRLTVPEGVEASTRSDGNKIIHILVNFSNKPATVVLPSPMKDELHARRIVRMLVLPVSGVAVLNETR